MNFLRKIFPERLKNFLQPYRKQIRNFKILAFEYGQWRTIKNWECVDKNGNPIRWFTYPAIEYLNHLDLSSFSVFEFGSGYSTLFWIDKVREVVSIEHDRSWYTLISEKLKNHENIKFYLFEEKADYISSLAFQKRRFDIYVIDGRWRGECAIVVVNNIKQYGGSVIIFDNSDWYPNTVEYLRKELGWIEVDFHGFGPINKYTWTTTMFVNNAIALSYKFNKLASIQSIKQIAEDDIL